MSRCRPGWKRVHNTLWRWGRYTVRRQSLDRTMYITHMAMLNGAALGGRDLLVEAQKLCEQHANDRQSRATA